MKKFSLLVLSFILVLAPLSFATYTPDGADIRVNGLTFEGDTKDAFQTDFDVTDPTADRTITVPDSDQTIGTATTVAVTTVDTAQLVANAADATILADVVDAAAANTACNTTCGIAGCYFGIEASAGLVVDCADATADSCACDGPVA